MIKIRLARCGNKNRPFYKIVITDSRNPRDGKFIENLGFFNPIANCKKIENLRINLNRINYWIEHGAKLSQRVSTLINKKIINETKK